MIMTSSGNHYMTATELAERWRGQVKLSTLAAWRSRRIGPAFVKIGGRVLYTLAAVEEYENRNTRR